MNTAGPFSQTGVEVTRRDADGGDALDTYATARTWDVLGGYLTLTDDDGKRLAAYAPLRWLSVRALG